MREKSKKILLTQRDMDIFNFLDRVGYANLKHIGQFLGDDSDKTLNAIMRRLYVLRRFDYLKVFHTHLGNYYALTRITRMENPLISTIKFDQLPHHDFLIDLFMIVKDDKDYWIETEREIRAYKKFGSKGKIPDMIISDWVIEYERTNKSNVDCKAVINHWVIDKNKKLCIIYATEEIKARYQRINPNVLLLSKDNISNIITVLKTWSLQKVDSTSDHHQSILDKFGFRNMDN